MEDSFAKVYRSIVASTIWMESDATRVVFITMLALSDRDGYVPGSDAGLARLCNVPFEAFTEAMRVLSSPDPHSRTPDNEGRRAERVLGGWLMLNVPAYRAKRTGTQVRNADAVARHRKRKAFQCNDVIPELEIEVDKASDTPTETQPLTDPRESARARAPKKKRWRRVPSSWKPTDAHRALAEACGVNLDREVEKFKDHDFAEYKIDPDRTFNNWLRRAAEMEKKRNGGRPRTSDVQDYSDAAARNRQHARRKR